MKIYALLIQLLDLNGRVVSGAVLNESATSAEMDMSQLPSGQYIVRAGDFSKVIIKQ